MKYAYGTKYVDQDFSKEQFSTEYVKNSSWNHFAAPGLEEGTDFLFHRRLMCSQKEESAYIWIILHKQKAEFVSQWLPLFDK